MVNHYRTPQFNQAKRILNIMRSEFGKPWQDNYYNVNAIAMYLGSNGKIDLPYYMNDTSKLLFNLQAYDFKNHIGD